MNDKQPGKGLHSSNMLDCMLARTFYHKTLFGLEIIANTRRLLSVQNVRWGRGSEAGVHFFQNSKMTILFKQNHNLIEFLFVRFWGERGGLQKEYVLYAHENDEKMDDSLCHPS